MMQYKELCQMGQLRTAAKTALHVANGASSWKNSKGYCCDESIRFNVSLLPPPVKPLANVRPAM